MYKFLLRLISIALLGFLYCHSPQWGVCGGTQETWWVSSADGTTTRVLVRAGAVYLPAVGTNGFIKLNASGLLSADTTTYATAGPITSSGLTMSTGKLLGRTTASTGAIEEISIGTGLSLSTGMLTNTVTAPTSANPTATAGATAVNGSATTYMRSDAAPAVQLAAADGSTKGIAAFNATNFSASSGVVNTIQGISTAATPQFTRLGLGVAADGTLALYASGTAKITGNTTIGAGTGAPNVLLDGAAGQNRAYRVYSGGSVRWQIGANSTSEAGANAGSNLFVGAYNDSGSFIGYSMFSYRSSMFVGFGNNSAPGEMVDIGTGNLRVKTGLLQVGNASAAAYNRLGTATTDHSLSAADDLLIGGKLEVNGAIYADSTFVGASSVSVKAGSSTAYANMGGVLAESHTDAEASGSGVENDIYSYPVPASVLSLNGASLHAKYSGTMISSSGLTPELWAYFGGTNVFDSGVLGATLGGSYWSLDVWVVRDSSSSVRVTTNMNTQKIVSGATYCQHATVTGLTLTDAQILKITGRVAGSSTTTDLIGKQEFISWYPPAL